MNLLQKVKSHLVNLPGWRTQRKIVVFESDDWGMIRMPSKESYQRLVQKGVPVDKSVYNRFDSLERNQDLEALMEVLDSVKDKNGSPARFTLNTIMANPNFQNIRESGYQKYFYEPFTETLGRYSHTDQVMKLYREGIEQKVFQPQFHGREHLQVNNWLRKLQSNNTEFQAAFEEGMYTVNPTYGFSCKEECLDGMATYHEPDSEFASHSVAEGLNLFEKTFGFRSRSVIAPCYTWHSDLEKTFADHGVKYIQGARAQREARVGQEKKVIKRHYMGQKSSLGLRYLIRNVHFEQVENPEADWVDSAMQEIKTAFRLRKPAIISSHRVNYIGRINTAHRDKNLDFLRRMLQTIKKSYPEVEFMSTDELGDLMNPKRS